MTKNEKKYLKLCELEAKRKILEERRILRTDSKNNVPNLKPWINFEALPFE